MDVRGEMMGVRCEEREGEASRRALLAHRTGMSRMRTRWRMWSDVGTGPKWRRSQLKGKGYERHIP